MVWHPLMGKKANQTVQMATSSNNKTEIKAKPKRLRRLYGGTTNVCVCVCGGGGLCLCACPIGS